MESRKEHWEKVYATKRPHEVSWTQDLPKTSLDFVHSYDCLSPLKDWTKIANQFSLSKFRNHDKNKATIYPGGEAQYPSGSRT